MNQEHLQQLRGCLRGRAFQPGESGYDEAREIWNGTITKQPALIVQCEGVADVADAVRFARHEGLAVSVRGGGHHVAGSALVDGGLVISLAKMRSVRVSAESSTVRAEGGAQIGDLDRESQVFNLAVPMGVVSETGIAGLTLGGGMGWMRRKYGLACDNLISADVVLADGRLVRAADDENADLFWALRGGGWDLGVVVSFELRAFPLGPDVFMTFVTYPMKEAKDVLRRFREAYGAAPVEAAPLAVCWTFPDAEIFPREVWGKPFVTAVGPYIGLPDEGERVMAPFRTLGTVLTDMSGVQPWVQAQKFFDEDYPTGRRYHWKSSYLEALTDDAIDVVLELAATRPSRLSSIDVWPLGGAIGDVGFDRSPFGHRDAPYAMGIESNWDEPADDAANIAFAREAIEKLKPFSTGGSYMNFEDPDDAAATAASYGPALDRLRRVKQQYDPENLFHSRRGLLAAAG